MYTIGIVKDTLFKDGMVKVVVEFPNGQEVLTETFETNQTQPDSWLEEQVDKKLAHLNKMLALANSNGVGQEFTEKEKAAMTLKDTYQQDLALFTQFVSAIRSGFTTESNPDFVALKAKLTTNFNSEYLDLF